MEWVEVARPLDESGQGCGVAQAQFVQIFVEVRARRLAKPVDAESAVPAEKNRVAVILQDLLLGQYLLQVQRNEHLYDLAFPTLVAAQPEISRELHGDGGRAL